MHGTRYKGTFYSRKGIAWEVRITQEEGTFSNEGSLTFPDEDPLTIELEDNEKEETICGSIAELTIVSPGDRTYADLYAEQAGAIRLEVYRNGLLYWVGSLDPEFYEEPYAYKDDYEVRLTFSDFGALDRIKYNLNGIRTLVEILQNGLSRIGLDINVNQDYISTMLDGETCTLDRVQIRSDNFVDEEGEWMSMKSVIEGMLQPLALKMVQRCGSVYVYDLNGLYQNGESEAIAWNADDQMLGTDKIANNAKVTLSVYADETLISDDLKLTSKLDNDAVNLQNTASGVNSYYPDYAPDWIDNTDAYKNISFSIHYGSGVKLEGLAEIGGMPFHIQPFFGGEEADGVAFMFYTGGHGSLKTGWPKRIGYAADDVKPRVLMRTKKVYLPRLSDYKDYLLRLTESILIDTRYNPFTSSGKYNEKDNFECIKSTTGYLLIPAMVQLYDDQGSVIAHYNNAKKTKSSETMGFVNNQGEWKSGPDPLDTNYIKGSLQYFTADAVSCFLEWYDVDDRKESAGIQGWNENRHSIGLSQKDVTGLIENLDNGEYIPYPSLAGYLEVTIVSGVYPYDFGEMWYHNGIPQGSKWLDKKNYDRLRWMLYKAPSVTICKNKPPYDGLDVDDIEYTGGINDNAKEDINIDTIAGTSEASIPASRSLLMSTSTGNQIHALTRAGRTTTAEQLLIGTLYSQYGSRHTKLTGTAAPITLPLPCLTENMQGDTKFLLTSSLENCKEDSAEVTLVEFRPDEYTDN